MSRILRIASAFLVIQVLFCVGAGNLIAYGSISKPELGNWLLFEVTWHGNPAQQVNYTFSEYPSPNVVNVTVLCANWTAIGLDAPPGNQGFIIINVMNGSFMSSSPKNMWMPMFFGWGVSGNNIVIGNSTYTIAGEENVTLGEVEYSCWNVTKPSISDVSYLVEKSTGVFFSAVCTQTGNEWALSLLEARIEDQVILPEFHSFLAIPLVMVASLLSVMVCRRKWSKYAPCQSCL